MSSSTEYLSTQEFAEKAGVSPNTVSKWLRTNKIEGEKKGRKWIIAATEISKVVATNKQASAPSPKKQTPAPKKTPSPSGKAYTILEFSEMTYLTEFGVQKWLKEGRLVGATDDAGLPMVDAASLDLPGVKRVLR